MKTNSSFTEPGTSVAGPKYKVVVNKQKGPYLVYGHPSILQKFIIPDEKGESWEYKEGTQYKSDDEPMALCRCGHSHHKPFCDGTHTQVDWDPTLTANRKPLLEEAEIYDSPRLELADNPEYCAHARFCMAKGTVWELTENSDDPEAAELAIRETFHCPSGRLKIINKEQKRFLEPDLSPSVGLIEDPQMECSGPLWVRGGIPIEDTDGKPFETRNRVTLCRCGTSGNKPFCDGTHIRIKFQDGLPQNAE